MTNSDLRQMVRDILREVVPPKNSAVAGIETVRIASDADLMAFARQVIDKQDAIASGRLRFTLAGPPPLGTSSAVVATLPGLALHGVITEHVVDRNASSGVLVLATGAVMTPLARDRARKLKLKIERRS